MWDLHTSKVIKSLRSVAKGEYYAKRLDLSVGVKRLVLLADYAPSGFFAYRIHIWDIENYKLVKEISPDFNDDVRGSTLSEDGKDFVVVVGSGEDPLSISIWSLEDGRPKTIKRQSSIKGNQAIWLKRMGMSVFEKDHEPALRLEKYTTDEPITRIDSVSKYSDLTNLDLSPEGLVLVSENNSTIYVRKRESKPLNVHDYSPEQLKTKGCELLRGQPEFKPVEAVCSQ